MDWDRLIPGHPGQPSGRLGTKKDAQDILTLMQEVCRDEEERARGEVLGAGGEGFQAAEIRKLAWL